VCIHTLDKSACCTVCRCIFGSHCWPTDACRIPCSSHSLVHLLSSLCTCTVCPHSIVYIQKEFYSRHLSDADRLSTAAFRYLSLSSLNKVSVRASTITGSLSNMTWRSSILEEILLALICNTLNISLNLSIFGINVLWSAYCASRAYSSAGLGVVISSRLMMGEHLDQLISFCASSIFALRTLRAHGLRPPQLHHVARATTAASLLYASPTWWSFASAEDRSRLERLVGRLRCGGYLPDDFPTVESLAGAADHKLFVSIAGNPHHVLRRHYHEKSPLVTTCTPGHITFCSPKRMIETLSPDPYMLNSKHRIFLFYFNFFCQLV